MSSGAAKLSISVPSALVEAIRRRVGPRGVSGFITKAIEHELEREQLETFLRELEEEHGAIPDDVLTSARDAWPKH
jgi:post-segregation antitoxin (ccd killing protein)